MKKTVACVISPHGYGHAARTAAVINAISEKLDGNIDFIIITKTPSWFFADSGINNFTWHEYECDLGLIQKDAFNEDIKATIEKLKTMLPVEKTAKPIADLLIKNNVCLAVCDISPFGLAAAKMADIPSILIENFTWDWIYEGYAGEWPEITALGNIIAKEFDSAGCRIQTQPVCAQKKCDLIVNPVSRKTKQSPYEIRKRLGVGENQKMVLLTMGGISGNDMRLPDNKNFKEVVFVRPGISASFQRTGNVIDLPSHSAYYHPDLVNASDAVIGKLGYSTLAECYSAGVPYGFVPRPRFRESPPLAQFCLNNMNALSINQEQISEGCWDDYLSSLLSMERNRPLSENGSEIIAEFIVKRFLTR